MLGGSASGQTNASLRGTVTDQSGGVVVGAKETLTNTGTGIARTTTSGSDGSYLFDLVQVGKYKLTVEKSGFTTFIQDGIVLELNQNGRADVSLKVGQAAQTVEVTANVAQVDTTERRLSARLKTNALFAICLCSTATHCSLAFFRPAFFLRTKMIRLATLFQ